MRRIEALTGDGADSFLTGRLATLERASDAAGANTVDALPERIAALQDELRESRRRLKAAAAAGGLPKPADLVGRTVEPAAGVRLIAYAGPFDSMDALKSTAKDLRGLVPSGVLALGLEADEPQVFVTVSPDLVARGIAAGDLVRAAVGPIDGKGGGRPEMAQGKGTRRDGLPAALEAISAALGASNGASG